MIKFHLPETHSNASVLTALIRLRMEKPEMFRSPDIKFASVFGSPQLPWNGGRVMSGPYDPTRTKALIRHYNSMGVPYRFTFTNPMITEEYLDDYDCNALLDFADNGLNEVIVNSPLLEEYIRKTHPRMKLTSSTCKCIRNMDDVKAELAKPYALVVLDYNFNNDFEQLEKLTSEERKRCELLSNSVCVPNCKRRLDHYKYLGELQLHYREFVEKYNRMSPEERAKNGMKEWECEYMGLHLFSGKEFPLQIKPDDVYGKYTEMGFENFKLEGRGAHMLMLSEQFTRYFAAPERADEFRYMLNFAAINHMRMNY